MIILRGTYYNFMESLKFYKACYPQNFICNYSCNKLLSSNGKMGTLKSWTLLLEGLKQPRVPLVLLTHYGHASVSKTSSVFSMLCSSNSSFALYPKYPHHNHALFLKDWCSADMVVCNAPDCLCQMVGIETGESSFEFLALPAICSHHKNISQVTH